MASSLKSLSTLWVFATLVFSTAESYMCVQCTGADCLSTPETCEASQGCFNNKQELILLGALSLTTEDKGCSSGACIPLAFSATLGSDRAFRYKTQCCVSDRCNGGDIQLSQVSQDYNGIECPACYTENGTFCSPQPLKCRGAETECVEVIGLVLINGDRLLTMSAMGCATKSACNLKDINVMQTPTNISTYCVGPASGSPALTPVVSWTLTSLFLLEVLL